jgi:NADPH:quinone reductase-like Zn-dependent oxidoreductase
VLDATGGKGADVIIETGGPGSLEKSFAAAAFNGRIGLIGGLAGQAEGPLNTMPLVGKNLKLCGVTCGSKKMLQDLIDTMVAANAKPVIDKTFPFDEAGIWKVRRTWVRSSSHTTDNARSFSRFSAPRWPG